jgi:hypothetical protein
MNRRAFIATSLPVAATGVGRESVASNSTEAPGRMVGMPSSASSAASCDANALLSTFRAPLFFRMVTTGDPIDEGLIIQATRVAQTLAVAHARQLSS